MIVTGVISYLPYIYNINLFCPLCEQTVKLYLLHNRPYIIVYYIYFN